MLFTNMDIIVGIINAWLFGLDYVKDKKDVRGGELS